MLISYKPLGVCAWTRTDTTVSEVFVLVITIFRHVMSNRPQLGLPCFPPSPPTLQPELHCHDVFSNPDLLSPHDWVRLPPSARIQANKPSNAQVKLVFPSHGLPFVIPYSKFRVWPPLSPRSITR